MSRLRWTKKGKKINKKKKNIIKYRKRCWIISGHIINDTRQWRLWVRVGFSERHLGQILSEEWNETEGGKKKNDTNFRGVGRGRARERLLLDQGRCSAIEGEKCVSSSRGASCAPCVHLALFANRSWPASWWPGNCRKDRATLR